MKCLKLASCVTLLSLALSISLQDIKQAIAQVPPEPTPTTTIELDDELLTIRLVNQTEDAIQYQVIGDTEVRTILGDSEVTLKSLRIPISLTFHYRSIPRSFSEQTGLLKVDLIEGSETDDLTVIMMPTRDPALDSSFLEIDVNGDVFVF